MLLPKVITVVVLWNKQLSCEKSEHYTKKYVQDFFKNSLNNFNVTVK